MSGKVVLAACKGVCSCVSCALKLDLLLVQQRGEHMIQCPKCDRELDDLRGLYGHLRFKHKLEGEELERVYGKEKKEQRHKQKLKTPPSKAEVQEMVEGEVGKWFGENGADVLKRLEAVELEGEAFAIDRPSVERSSEPEKPRDPVIRKLDAYRRARDRRIAVEEVGEIGMLSKPVFGGASMRATWDRWQELYEQCKREEEAAEEELQEAVERSAQDRAEEADEPV